MSAIWTNSRLGGGCVRAVLRASLPVWIRRFQCVYIVDFSKSRKCATDSQGGRPNCTLSSRFYRPTFPGTSGACDSTRATRISGPFRLPLDGNRHIARYSGIYKRNGFGLAAGKPLVARLNRSRYVVSHWSPNGHYADDAGYFGTLGVANQALYAPRTANTDPTGPTGPATHFRLTHRTQATIGSTWSSLPKFNSRSRRRQSGTLRARCNSVFHVGS
jgi:hypothetical protein